MSTVEPPSVPDHLSPAVLKRAPDGTVSGRQGLTPKQERLAKLLASGVRVGLAGELAGYLDTSASATRASRSPAVRARVIQLQRGKLQRLSVLATSRLADILTGKLPATAATVLEAVRYVHKAAGLDEPEDNGNNHKDLRLMTMEELEAIARKSLDAKLASIEPIRPGDDAQHIDIIDESVT